MKLHRLNKPKKQQLEAEQLVADTIASISMLEQDFAEKEKNLTARAEKAESELASLRVTHDNYMKILNQMITCFFGT